MNAQAVIEERLQALAPVTLVINDKTALHRTHAEGGSGAHLLLEITSDKFEGLSRLQRHRLVYETVGSLEEVGVHALAITAKTPAEAQ